MMLALAVQAGIRSARGELGAALRCAEQAHRQMPPGPASFPQWFVGFCLCPLDRFDEAMRFFDQATRDAEQMGSPFASSIADASRAAALLAAGRLDDAAVAAENAIDTAVLLGLGQPLGEGLRVLTEIQVRRGDLAAAKATVGQLRPLLAREQATATATRAVIPYLRAQGGGRLLQLSSMGGHIAFPAFSLYHAAKWGIEGFYESLAAEVEPFGIRTTLVEPGMIRSTSTRRQRASRSARPTGVPRPTGHRSRSSRCRAIRPRSWPR